MWDLNSPTKLRKGVANWIVDQIDLAILDKQSQQPRRDYLGGSYIGRECERAIQLEFLGEPKDEDREFSPELLRIFQRGHVMEDMVAEWLRDAGFDLRTHGADGHQFGFVSGKGKFRGHADGVIIGWQGEGETEMQFPALWESKALNAKGWAQVVRHGVRKSRPVYYGQMQLYMHHLDLASAPALFTAVNADTMELHCELVPFDAEECQRLIDRAVRIIQASDAHELLPRGSGDRDSFMCRFCSWQARCWDAS